MGLARPSVEGDHDVAGRLVARNTDRQGSIQYLYVQFSRFRDRLYSDRLCNDRLYNDWLYNDRLYSDRLCIWRCGCSRRTGDQ